MSSLIGWDSVTVLAKKTNNIVAIATRRYIKTVLPLVINTLPVPWWLFEPLQFFNGETSLFVSIDHFLPELITFFLSIKVR